MLGPVTTGAGVAEVVIYAVDLARLRDFYRAVLGLDVQEVGEGFVTLGPPDGALSIVAMPAGIAAELARRPVVPITDAAIKPVLLVASLDVALDAVGAHGGQPAEGATTWTYLGRRRQDVVDPDGNVVQLAERA
ncbi:VOC family protein [Nocardioides sp.]|uniref:VOC family protein n=1 Tax=Nocardioides sp. TaxID=35761 RepID=UPI0035657623